MSPACRCSDRQARSQCWVFLPQLLSTFFFFFNIISWLILWEFHSLHPNSTHLPITPISTPTLEGFPQEKILKNENQTNPTNKQKTNKQLHSFTFLPVQHLFIRLSGIGSCSVSRNIPFCPISLTHKCSLKWAIGLVLGFFNLISLAKRPHWIWSSLTTQGASSLGWDYTDAWHFTWVLGTRSQALHSTDWDIVPWCHYLLI